MSPWKTSFVAVIALWLLVTTERNARAEFVVTMQQVGPDVVATGDGTINTTALTFYPDVAEGQGAVEPSVPYLGLGPTPPTLVDLYDGISGPTNFGNGALTFADTGSGDTIAMSRGTGLLLFKGFDSGAALSNTDTWTNATLSSLGITPGTYTWTWGSGATADSFKLIALPEPASLGLLGFGCLSLLVCRRRNH